MKIKPSDIFTVVPFKKLKSTKAWKLTSEYVRRKYHRDDWPKDWGTCYTCGTLTPISKLSAGHFREKIGGAATYFDLDNLRPQCYRCNKLRHGEKDTYALQLLAEIGKKRFNDLFLKGQQSKQWTKAELNDIAEERQKDLDNLKVKEE